ncbi:hypothetical protein BD414DRAFT_476174 [Trametes punicea]|nr:hypothetical protein BD414DRAFT_476174 [Trametes punicea]
MGGRAEAAGLYMSIPGPPEVHAPANCQGRREASMIRSSLGGYGRYFRDVKGPRRLGSGRFPQPSIFGISFDLSFRSYSGSDAELELIGHAAKPNDVRMRSTQLQTNR